MHLCRFKRAPIFSVMHLYVCNNRLPTTKLELVFSFSQLQAIVSVLVPFFQVGIQQAMEPLQAEANALLLGAKLARALNLQRANLITDNEVLAKTARTASLRHSPGHWSLRPVLAEFADVTQGITSSILKISRQNNKVADKLAKMARQASIPISCLFSCNALSHNLHCPVRDALANLQWGNFTLISVTCL